MIKSNKLAKEFDFHLAGAGNFCQCEGALSGGLTGGVPMASLALASRADYSHLRAASRDGDVHFIRSFLRERDPYDLTSCIEDAETDGCTALWFASAHGHADAVAELLAHNANTEKARDGGATPLIVAAREGHLECVKALVIANADLGASCPGEGRTPMHLAAHRGHADICALLLAHGADPTLEDAKGMTPCMVAAHNGHHAVLRCLVADNGSGAQRFDGEHNFRTAALLLASAEGNAESVRALLQAPADARRAASCLHAALCGGDLASQRVVEVLLKGADVDGATEVTKSFDGKNGGGTRALHFAAEVGNRGVTKALLDADPDVDALDARGRTPLYVAAHHGHEDVVSSLLSAGADVNRREKFREETPLFAAARGGHLECVKALCAHEDVDVDARDDHWATPLHAAVAEGHVACVDWLLDRGADPNAADKNMETALHVSVRWADARVTASLLRAGASVNKYTKRGLTPLHLAVSGAGAQSRASASAVSSLSVYGDPVSVYFYFSYKQLV